LAIRFARKDPPRKFRVGVGAQIEISDCGSIFLDSDEQVTFVMANGARHDFTAKSWGFYATPSVNGRLKDEGLKTALVRNAAGRHYVMVVSRERQAEFESYLAVEDNEVVEWLDERN